MIDSKQKPDGTWYAPEELNYHQHQVEENASEFSKGIFNAVFYSALIIYGIGAIIVLLIVMD